MRISTSNIYGPKEEEEYGEVDCFLLFEVGFDEEVEEDGVDHYGEWHDNDCAENLLGRNDVFALDLDSRFG
jgi:hypothetical protein